MVFANAIALTGAMVLVIQRWQGNSRCDFIHGPALVDAPNRLIPQKLKGVAVALRRFTNLVTTRQRRAMRCHKMFRCPCNDVVDSRNQHTRIAIFLTTNSEHIKEHWPHRVVHAYLRVREEKVDGVVAVTG